MADCSDNKVFEDNVMIVKYVPLTRASNSTVDDNKIEVNRDDFNNAEVNATVTRV